MRLDLNPNSFWLKYTPGRWCLVRVRQKVQLPLGVESRKRGCSGAAEAGRFLNTALLQKFDLEVPTAESINQSWVKRHEFLVDHKPYIHPRPETLFCEDELLPAVMILDRLVATV